MDREISLDEKRKQIYRKLIPFLIAVMIIIIIVILLSRLFEPRYSRKEFDIKEVDKGSIEITVTASGKLTPLLEEIIVSPINSRILETYKNIGDTVKVGEALLRLDLSSVETEYKQKLDEKEMMKSKLIQLEVKLDNSISELSMQQQLKEMQLQQLFTDLQSELYLDSIGASTSDKVRRAELAYDEVKLQLQQLKQKIQNEKKNAEAELNIQRLELSIFEKKLGENMRLLKDARILSPKNAILTFIDNQIGTQVIQGRQVAIVSDLSSFKVECEIADGHREKLSLGAKAIVKTDEIELTGTIVNITPSIINGVINFNLMPDNVGYPGLRSGLKADVYVLYGKRLDVLRIPNGTWFNRGKGIYDIWVINGDKIEKRKVNLGESSFDYVEVISGLSEGEQVILSDMEKYRNKKSMKLK